MTHQKQNAAIKHLRTMSIVKVFKIIPKVVKLNWKNFILLSCGILELLWKVPKRRRNPPVLIGLRLQTNCVTNIIDSALLFGPKISLLCLEGLK